MLVALGYAVAIASALVGIVVALALHEFAHAVPLLLDGGRVHVRIGSEDGRTVGIGPLTVTAGFDSIEGLVQFGYYEVQDTHSDRVRAVAALAGPSMTVLVVVLVGFAFFNVPSGPSSVLLGTILISEAYRAIQTIVPKTYSDGPYAEWDSDGKRFLRLVRS